VARVVHARAPDIAIVDSTSRGNNLAVQMIDAPPGANVVVDSTTYPSALMPWFAHASDVEVRRVPDDAGFPILEAFQELADERTVAISVSHVSPTTGFRHRLRPLAKVAHRVGALLLVDAAQSAGAVAIDVGRDGIDLMAFGAMKWLLGTPGIAFLYVNPAVGERLLLPHAGPGGARLHADTLVPAEGAARHQISSAHWGGLSASRRGAELLLELGLDAVEARIQELADLVAKGLRERGLDVLTPADAQRRAGIVAFRYARADALFAHLRKRGVDVWAWGDRALVRADPHVYNSASDVERFLRGVESHDLSSSST
jgi:selenocysteine lyase/cysteine desulfurase